MRVQHLFLAAVGGGALLVFMFRPGRATGIEPASRQSSHRHEQPRPKTAGASRSAASPHVAPQAPRVPRQRSRAAPRPARTATGPWLAAASAAATPLSTTPPPPGKQMLSADDFSYLGAVRLPDSLGWLFGLAYRPQTRTFFSIGFAGRPPYRLVEYSLAKPSSDGQPPRGALVKDWGPLDPNQRLSQGEGMWRMEGLFWDDSTQRLWLSWGNYYNADHKNSPCLAYATLDPLALHGPWKVPAGVHSEKCRGQIKPSPKALAAVTHMPWTMFGGRGNTAQAQTWGTGLVAVADPGGTTPGAEISATTLVHWPMIGQEFADPRKPTETLYHYYSAFPRMEGDVCRRITGNAGVKLPDHPSYEFNVMIDDNTHFQKGDGVFHSAWIETSSREGLFYYGQVTVGYSWYGNGDAHCDSTPAGLKWQNNLESLLVPGEKCIDHDPNKGDHAERFLNRAYFVNLQDVLAVARKAKSGRLRPADLQVPPVSIADFDKLGGKVPHARTLSDCYWNADERKLYVLATGLDGEPGTMLVWSVRD